MLEFIYIYICMVLNFINYVIKLITMNYSNKRVYLSRSLLPGNMIQCLYTLNGFNKKGYKIQGKELDMKIFLLFRLLLHHTTTLLLPRWSFSAIIFLYLRIWTLLGPGEVREREPHTELRSAHSQHRGHRRWQLHLSDLDVPQRKLWAADHTHCVE